VQLNDSAADPKRLAATLPADPPAGWTRTDEASGLVEYRLPDEQGVCTAGKVRARPDVLGDAAVRVDFIKGCRSAGTTHYESAERASEAVERALETAVSDRSAAARTDEADA
jgi:hypothetical protein